MTSQPVVVQAACWFQICLHFIKRLVKSCIALFSHSELGGFERFQYNLAKTLVLNKVKNLLGLSRAHNLVSGENKLACLGTSRIFFGVGGGFNIKTAMIFHFFS